MKSLFRLLGLLTLLESPCILWAKNDFPAFIKKDTCAVNDVCSSAIDLQVFHDNGFTCVTGCNSSATPELFDNPCGIGQFPTVWYKVHTDVGSMSMNIQVQSDELRSPTLSLYKGVPDCDHLVPAGLTAENLLCVQGYDGFVKAIGTEITENQDYYIAINDRYYGEGAFELCVNTLSTSGSNCVTDRNIEITARSNGGPLNGPYEPGETISICLNVNSYTGANNGCQWFQGIVPVFGNGWDPSSFDANGLPQNATVNGNPMGVPGNGNYGNATWDLFTDVDYHFVNPYLQVQDFDHNGTVDLCSTQYDPHCPDGGGLEASCCGPCWNGPLGTILPPGWLAYGINGTCPTPGPPIRVDWGDGNTCGDGMGPWKFCFDLVTRSFPDCDYDKSTLDLTLEFFTFTDGETGSWTGSSPPCYDQPAYWHPGFHCSASTDLGTVILPNQCSGNLVSYGLFEPGIDYWEWTVSPLDFVNDSIFEGGNDDTLVSHPRYTGSSSGIIVYNLTGHVNSTGNTVVKQIIYKVWPKIEFQLPEHIEICEHKPGTVTIIPSLIKGGKPPYNYLWSPSGDTLPSLVLQAPFQTGTISLTISDTIGCLTMDSLVVKLKSCHFDDPGNEPNDTINPEPPLPNDGNFTFPDVKRHGRSIDQINDLSFQIHPTPTSGNAIATWSFDLQQDATIEIFNIQGLSLSKIPVHMNEGHQKQIDSQSLAPGVYFVSFSNCEFRYVIRLVKM